MPKKLPKKGDHEPKKYFEGEAVLSETEKLTEQKITTPEKFEEYDIEALCSKFFVNKVYYKMAKRKRREKALAIAANVVLEKGVQLQEKLNQNDLQTDKKSPSDQNKNLSQNLSQSQKSSELSKINSPEKAGKSDIPKISGGTLSEVIAKITEMLAGKSGRDFQKGANNLAAMIETLATPEVEKKFGETIKCLAQDLVLVADIKEILKDTKAASIFNLAIDQNFSAAQKADLNNVSKAELNSRRQENIACNVENKKLLDEFQRNVR
jgi:hypothetical protein